MAKHRLRICVGYNDDGSSVVKRISGNTELELADNIVKVILNSARRTEFIQNEAAPSVRESITFQKYTENGTTPTRQDA